MIKTKQTPIYTSKNKRSNSQYDISIKSHFENKFFDFLFQKSRITIIDKLQFS